MGRRGRPLWPSINESRRVALHEIFLGGLWVAAPCPVFVDMAGCYDPRPKSWHLPPDVVKWLNRNPVRSLPGCCLKCGDRDNPHDSVLPYGAQPTWPTPGRIACNLSRWPHITTYQRSTLGVNSLRSVD